jgi:hypothetical protein
MSVTNRQRALAGKILAEPGISMYKAMRAVGYSHSTAKNPKDIIQSKNFKQLLEERLPDDDLLQVHQKLLHSKRIDHMTFPLSAEDWEIEELIHEVGGTLRNIKHGLAAKQAYWWVDNERSQLAALTLAYKIKGRLDPKTAGEPPNKAYDSYLSQHTIDPNTPENKRLNEAITAAMMEATKREDPAPQIASVKEL